MAGKATPAMSVARLATRNFERIVMVCLSPLEVPRLCAMFFCRKPGFSVVSSVGHEVRQESGRRSSPDLPRLAQHLGTEIPDQTAQDRLSGLELADLDIFVRLVSLRDV